MRTLVVLIVLFASTFPINFALHVQELPAGNPSSLSGKQGEVLVFTIPITGKPDRVTGRLLDREILFFPIGDEKYSGLLGLDMQDQPGQHELEVQVQYLDRSERHTVSYTHLTLPTKA